MTTSSASPTFSFDLDQTRPKKRPGPESPPHVRCLARLLALALKLEGLVRDGTVHDYATLARLGHVSRARLSQLMNLLVLAPDIQEEILFLPASQTGRDAITLRHLQPIALVPSRTKQRRLWHQLKRQLVRDVASSAVATVHSHLRRKPKNFVSPNDHPG
jgi:hypothetical protein